MGLFPEAELPPGLWGPIASFNCQENVSMFTANMIRIAFAFRVVFFCFSSSFWEAVGSQENDFYKVLGLENQAVLLWVLPFHLYLSLPPSSLHPLVIFGCLLPSSTRSHLRFKLNLSGSLL